ncbi:MAG: GNAT family N-acetyltransferase [Rhodobacteraceae bacterium]|nr:GNAT family N-acetyltransferase [Paracoccaceae bacterium]
MGAKDMAAIHAAVFVTTRPWAAHEFESLLYNGAFAVGNADCFALVRVALDEVELLTIATHPTHQRQGLAHGIMTDWQSAARKRGATRAFLEVAADNLPAIALYHACEFKPNGLRPGYYQRDNGRKIDALMMARALT